MEMPVFPDYAEYGDCAAPETDPTTMTPVLGEDAVFEAYGLFLAERPASAPLVFAPHETRAINLRKLRDAQLADFKQNKIPVDATDGSVNWIRLDNVPVMGRMVVLQRHGGMASGDSCGTCMCPPNYVSLYIDPGSATLAVGEDRQFRAYGGHKDCNGWVWYYDVTCGDEDEATAWSSSYPSVATVYYGLVSAWAGGSTTIGAGYHGWKYQPDVVGECKPAYMVHLYAYSTVNVYSFTVNISPSVVAPLNAGTPNATTVTVQTNPFVSGKTVSLQDVRVANTGGHLNHPLPNSNVSGTFNPASGTTDSQGRFQSTYTVKQFGGEYQIKATIEGTTVTGPITLWAQVQGLGQLSGGGNYYNSNSPAGQIAHPDNWRGTSTTRNGLVATANAFASQYPGSPVPYNDISLLWGGKFDGNAANWTGGHDWHREGRDADINVCSPWGSQDRRNALWQLFSDNGTTVKLDECSTNNCWHMRW